MRTSKENFAPHILQLVTKEFKTDLQAKIFKASLQPLVEKHRNAHPRMHAVELNRSCNLLKIILQIMQEVL